MLNQLKKKNMGLFNKSENWWLRLTIVVIVVGFLCLLSMENRRIGETSKSHQNQIDSLETEIFIQKNMVGRYEITLDMLKEEDSIAAQKFENILYTKTE